MTAAIGSSSSVRPTPRAPAAPPKVKGGSDSDGDNDGSKGKAVAAPKAPTGPIGGRVNTKA